jgi:hypothetical protein
MRPALLAEETSQRCEETSQRCVKITQGRTRRYARPAAEPRTSCEMRRWSGRTADGRIDARAQANGPR